MGHFTIVEYCKKSEGDKRESERESLRVWLRGRGSHPNRPCCPAPRRDQVRRTAPRQVVGSTHSAGYRSCCPALGTVGVVGPPWRGVGLALGTVGRTPPRTVSPGGSPVGSRPCRPAPRTDRRTRRVRRTAPHQAAGNVLAGTVRPVVCPPCCPAPRRVGGGAVGARCSDALALVRAKRAVHWVARAVHWPVPLPARWAASVDHQCAVRWAVADQGPLPR
mmetsp:Transcript_42174/g.98932  ORF Transcript_42174/g.98932 Transcript_42174/m.98932 type:complete len:220 (-) Transcript_42174:418-1077(-)